MMINGDKIRSLIEVAIPDNSSFDQLALVNADNANSLTFIDDSKFLDQLITNDNITGVLATKEMSAQIQKENLQVIISTDPRFDFYTLINYEGKENYKEIPSVISSSAKIHPTAFVDAVNVTIGEHTVIGPGVTILRDVSIGNNCVVHANTVIGAEGFEYKVTTKGLLGVFHDGKVIIGDKVVIGALNGISKGFTFRNTLIGDETKTDNLVHIAHAVQIGKRCLLPASCMIAGSATIEDDVWIGPNASISSQVTIESGGYITIGAVVTRGVKSGEKVTGNFAIAHSQFMENLKKSLSDKE